MPPKKEFTFDEKRHRYYLDGKAMTGCTTVLGVIAKPALIQWAADKAAAYALGCKRAPGLLKEYNNVQAMEDWREKKQAKGFLEKK